MRQLLLRSIFYNTCTRMAISGLIWKCSLKGIISNIIINKKTENREKEKNVKINCRLYHHSCNKMDGGNKILVHFIPLCIPIKCNDHRESVNSNKSESNLCCKKLRQKLLGIEKKEKTMTADHFLKICQLLLIYSDY